MYLLLFRHATLVLRHLSTHPDALQPSHRPALLQANKDVQSSLAKLEALKPRLNKRYERYEQDLKVSDSRVKATFTPVDDDNNHPIASDDRPWLPSSKPKILSRSENATSKTELDIAITMAQNEIRRRASSIKTLKPTVTKKNVLGTREIEGLGDWEGIFLHDERGLHHTARELQNKNSSLPVHSDSEAISALESSNRANKTIDCKYRYPKVHQHSASRSMPLGKQAVSLSEEWSSDVSSVKQPPDPPPKTEAIFAFETRAAPKLTQEADPDLEDFVGVVHPSPVSSSHKTSPFTFRYSASLENGAFLRTVFLPPSLRISFLSLALPNTRANLETCGILCGTLISNAFFISKLVIPDQESTSDTCETVNEDKLFDYVDGEDLMVLGWIHTHPTQTCFMSSRDLHTHAGYQAMMPESIAIVCAPSKGEYVHKVKY